MIMVGKCEILSSGSKFDVFHQNSVNDIPILFLSYYLNDVFLVKSDFFELVIFMYQLFGHFCLVIFTNSWQFGWEVYFLLFGLGPNKVVSVHGRTHEVIFVPLRSLKKIFLPLRREGSSLSFPFSSTPLCAAAARTPSASNYRRRSSPRLPSVPSGILATQQ